MKLREARSKIVRAKTADGFTLIEMILASAVLLVAVASVVQLVPASLQTNLFNRMDTTATTIAQHYLDQMLAQPLSSFSFSDVNGTYSLGDQSNPGNAVGSPVIMFGSMATIDFSAGTVLGYSLTYKDPNDPTGASFDLRWAVIPVLNNPSNISGNNTGAVLASRRIIIGCRQTNAAQFMQPVNLDSSVQK